jgi:hypothetical protein
MKDPWYLPKSGVKDAPLQPHGELFVGCEHEEGLIFSWIQGHTIDISYVKIFATMEHTVLSSMMQRYIPPSEDESRGLTRELNLKNILFTFLPAPTRRF